MLYSEFLEGTKASDNRYNYSEYCRINNLYMESDSMTKTDAYKLYNPPNDFVLTLLDENSQLKKQISKIAKENMELEEKLCSTEKKLEIESKWNKECLQNIRRNLSNALYTLEDKLGIL